MTMRGVSMSGNSFPHPSVKNITEEGRLGGSVVA